MGHSLSKQKSVSPELLKPQGLYANNKDIDLKRLKRHILDKKLAPCYKGSDYETAEASEECCICMLHYPALNKTRCCTKGLCTECFLQIKSGTGTRSNAPCPFCKESLIVIYNGPRSYEERLKAKRDEQAVLEAQMRARESEDRQAEELSRLRVSLAARSLEAASSSQSDVSRPAPPPTPRQSMPTLAMRQARSLDSKLSQYVPSDILQGSDVCGSEHMDLNDLMLMQAIYASLRDQGGGSEDPSTSGDLPEFESAQSLLSDGTPTTSGGSVSAAALQSPRIPSCSREIQQHPQVDPPSTATCSRDEGMEFCTYSIEPCRTSPSVQTCDAPGVPSSTELQPSPKVAQSCEPTLASPSSSSAHREALRFDGDLVPAVAKTEREPDAETRQLGDTLDGSAPWALKVGRKEDLLDPVSAVSDLIPALRRVSSSEAGFDNDLLDSSVDSSQATIHCSKSGSELYEISGSPADEETGNKAGPAGSDSDPEKTGDAALKPGFSMFARFKKRAPLAASGPTPSGPSTDVFVGMVLIDRPMVPFQHLQMRQAPAPSATWEGGSEERDFPLYHTSEASGVVPDGVGTDILGPSAPLPTASGTMPAGSLDPKAGTDSALAETGEWPGGRQLRTQALGLAEQLHDASVLGGAGQVKFGGCISEVDARQEHELSAGCSSLGGRPANTLDEDSCAQESTSGIAFLDIRGGPVLMQNPDGTEQLVLLMNEAFPPETEGPPQPDEASNTDMYLAPSDPADAALVSAIARGDQELLNVYAGSASAHVEPNSTADDETLVAAITQSDQALLTAYADQPAAVPTSSTQEEDWLARMRAQDEALARAIIARDAAVAAASRS